MFSLRSLRFSRSQIVYMTRLFLLFLVLFILLQVLFFLLSKAFLPYQVFIDARGWIVKSLLLLVSETIVMSLVAAGLCFHFVHQILGPVPRIIENIQLMLKSGTQWPITIREEDKLKFLVDEINRLIAAKPKEEGQKK